MEHPETVFATGNHYVMDIIDDFSLFMWAIPLASKGAAFPALQAWERAHELETGLHIGIYHLDNGELKSSAMKEWLLCHGTQHQFTAPYTSAHNGCVERVHRTLMSCACTMHLASNLPPNCWDEFVVMSCYLSNRISVKSQQGLTPFERWSGHNPKVNAHSVECVLIRYSADSKAYHCYHCPTNKVFVSFHVSFIESHETIPHPFRATTDPSNTDNTAPATPPPLPPTPLAPSDIFPQRSTRVIQPSECLCALTGIPYVPPANVVTCSHQ